MATDTSRLNGSLRDRDNRAGVIANQGGPINYPTRDGITKRERDTMKRAHKKKQVFIHNNNANVKQFINNNASKKKYPNYATHGQLTLILLGGRGLTPTPDLDEWGYTAHRWRR